MDIMTSVTTELALWDIFQTTRGANTTALLGGIIAIWVAARFSSVSVDKNVNMVGRIVVTVFAIEEPDIKPVIPDPRIAAFAGPPLIFPTIANARFKKYFPPPAVSKSAPNNTNKKIKSTETPIGIPNIAS